ncbi:BON domain-containing protein [Panacagrimonas perspica]|uniref:BON domain-containing protein n=1 Tax=Panacagrimonas perspica TaxID=381431 RepID=A0A4S3K5G6_9GAMM|nr:BON domain-containing protein [Panacagrimonas perspica]TDU31497.1 BON domain-containing protein [Panacagrimonas perspica]THD03365.1 hypothetical protein B1810_11910 [Panacagrimonas perspica]
MKYTSTRKTLFAAALLGLTCATPMAFAEGATAGAKIETAADKTGEYLSDSALTAKVKTALVAEKNLKSLGINVESTDGVVTLSGKVPNEASIEQAGAATKAVVGVKDVHNKLELKTKS